MMGVHYHIDVTLVIDSESEAYKAAERLVEKRFCNWLCRDKELETNIIIKEGINTILQSLLCERLNKEERGVE